MASDLHVSIISVPVADQARARDFYRDKLGFGVMIENPDVMGPDRHWVVLTSPAGGCQISLVNWYDTMPAGSLRGLVVETAELEAEHQRLRDLGVDIGDIKSEFWGLYATLRDSEGNGLILMKPLSR